MHDFACVICVMIYSQALLCATPHLGNFRAKFPRSPILHYACTSLSTENNGKNNATAIILCAVFVFSWW